MSNKTNEIKDDKVYLECEYMYEENGKVITAEYKSQKQHLDSSDINLFARALASEIRKELGHSVKNFLTISVEPVVKKKIYEVNGIKTRNGISIGKQTYQFPVTEDEIKEAEENGEMLQNLIVDMIVDAYKKNRNN